ncbi:hypothetical protein ACS0TY_019227 [Phlomoides rotata]
MAMARILVLLMAIFAVMLTASIQRAQAQELAPAPAPTSDGSSIDQGIAYLLMVLALALTYLIH